MATDTKLVIQLEQHNSRPQGPIPPMRPASWRAPICFISMRTRNASASTLITYDQAYYGYMYDITNDYKIYLEGQTYELPFDVDSFSN